jgi:hypothetical protein
VQVAPDSSGKKMRARSRTVGVDTVYEQFTALAGMDTWIAYADAVVFAASKQHISIFNAVGSGVTVRARKLFPVNLQSGAITGVWCRFDIKKITALSAGTTVTPVTHDSQNAALPAGVTVKTGGTATEGALIFPWVTTNDEETAVAALSKALFQQSINTLIEGTEIQEQALREGEGLTCKQITSTTVGSYGWILVFTVDQP